MTKRIDTYLLAQSLPAVLFGVLLYSMLGVISVTIPRLQWIVGAPIGPLLGWLALQLPTSIVQTLPLAVVLGVLLSYGRLAADRELHAMQAGGIALPRINRVYFILGALCTLGGLAINEYVLPHTHREVATRYWQLTSGSSGLFRLAQQALSVDDFTLNFGRSDRDTDRMHDVRIERWDGREMQVIFADSAVFADNGIRLTGYRTYVADFAALERGADNAEELLAALLLAENVPTNPDATLFVHTSESQADLVARFDQGGFEDSSSVTGAFRAAADPELNQSERRRMLITFHRRLAEPFGSFALLLLALPLAARYSKSRGLAFGLAVLVTGAWYLLMTFGQLLAQTGAIPVWLGLWLASLVLAVAGLAMRIRLSAGA